MPRNNKHIAVRWHDKPKDQNKFNILKRHTIQGVEIPPNRCACGKAMK